MKVLALVGSLRADSFNSCVMETMKERYAAWSISVADIGSLPFYNQDVELIPPPIVKAFKKQVSDTEAIIIVTPEYNWSIPGVLKNALDWLSRVELVMVGKPVLIIGASTGMIGTLRAQTHLRQILSGPGLNARVLPPAGNEVLVNFADSKCKNGRLADEQTLLFLDQVINRFNDWVKTNTP
ncbi:NADPH-dependent FMN reductase [Paenibacillus abyssi]|uniref:FMN reductase n=1 Tax=Paenibacillus abyssi TaxID=1340531 RepID=A0A917D5D5_9BACL|nr:NADPH-dependent FMN reductase [Paenibacillus abyssi]GGG11314.1 FMN reductase [Paenibacillus abyssi]